MSPFEPPYDPLADASTAVIFGSPLSLDADRTRTLSHAQARSAPYGLHATGPDASQSIIAGTARMVILDVRQVSAASAHGGLIAEVRHLLCTVTEAHRLADALRYAAGASDAAPMPAVGPQ